MYSSLNYMSSKNGQICHMAFLEIDSSKVCVAPFILLSTLKGATHTLLCI